MKERVQVVNLAEQCEDYIKIFGTNKNVYRVMPSMQDGLKPVARRFLYSLYKGKGKNNYIKMSKATGDTMSDYHPHGGDSISEVGGRMASPIFNNAMAVDGKGNFGSYKNSDLGAARYIEVKLSKYGMKCFFEDYEISNVDIKLNYTGDLPEPEVLPAKYPNALFNPQISGIGYGKASNIPPFNVKEVLEETIKIIKNPKAKVYLIPDSPTGADIVDNGEFENICYEGTGKFVLRGSAEIDEALNTITITSIPLQITIDEIIRNIAELREKKIFTEIERIDDYTSNKNGVKTIIYLAKDANPHETLKKLYSKQTGLQATYPANLCMIDDYRCIDYSVDGFLREWIEYRRDTIRSSYNMRFVKLMEAQSMNDILLFITNKENAVKTTQMAVKAKTGADFAEKLIKTYDIDSFRAKVIATMRMTAFNRDSYEKYLIEKERIAEELKEVEDILDNEDKIDLVMIEQLKEGIKLFGSPRKSKVVTDEVEEDVPDSEHLIAISKDGYIKKVSSTCQKIGQVGETTGQYITIPVNNRWAVLVFDSSGRVSKIPVSTLTNMKAKDIGVPIDRYFKVTGSVVAALIEPTEKMLKKDGKDWCNIFVTKQGFAKKTLLSEFLHINGSTQAIKVPAGDELVSVGYITDNTSKDIVLYTNKGNGIRRTINEFPTMKPNARGTRQLSLSNDEYCVGFDIINPDKKYLFYLTSAGRVKLTEMKYLPTMSRKDEVVSLISLEKRETLIGLKSVVGDESVMVYKKHSAPEILELPNIPILTRIAKPQKQIKTASGDPVITYTVYTK